MAQRKIRIAFDTVDFRNTSNVTDVKITVASANALAFAGNAGEAIAITGLKTQYSLNAVNTASDTIGADDTTTVVDYTTTGACILTLPAASGVSGHVYTIIDRGRNAGANNITIETAGVETIMGESNMVLNADGQAIALLSDGTNWMVW
jgi:hypothetical protein